MTARAQLANRAPRLEGLHVADRPMGVVTRRARHLAFANRHVRDGPLGLRDLDAMACHTELRLIALHELVCERLRAVHAVARRTGQVAALVRAAFPSGVFSAVVTGETGRVDLARLHLREFLNVAFLFVVDVRLPRTVTALAAVGRGRSTGVLRLRMLRALERFFLRGVTRRAGIAAGVAGRRCGWRRLTGCLGTSRTSRLQCG